MTDRGATELLPLPPSGRRYTTRRTVRLGDVDPLGALRFDAIGRYLQDVASDDAIAAGLDNALGWVVRRTTIRVDTPPSGGDDVELTTWCTGSGRSWAERRTSVDGPAGGRIDAVSLWVQLDVATGRPARLGDGFFEVYGEAAAGRQVSSKLSLPAPGPSAADAGEWSFRRSDLDQFGHVNNAAQFAVVEELLDHLPAADRRGTLEIEYLAPADAGVRYLIRRDGGLRWLVDDAGVVTTALAWTPARS